MAAPAKATFLDLSDDIIIDNICPLLDADDFLALCSTCSHLRGYSKVASYWRPLLQSTFQLPPQPLLQADGPRWKDMYQRLSKKSLLFTWGSVNSMRGQFGHVDASRARISHMWPTPLMPREIDGIVVQVACGGRSLTMRTSKGILYSIGDQEMGLTFAAMKLRKLEFPRGNSEPGADPSTTIVAMSKGRYEVLGLSKNGRIWCWSTNQPWAREINFSDLHSLQSVYDSRNPERRAKMTCPQGVKLICAGWGGSAAYLEGRGIALWDRDENPGRARSNSIGRSMLARQPEPARDVELKLVPGTGFLQGIDAKDQFNAEVQGYTEPLGQVVGMAYLEDDIIVFLTDNGKVYAAARDADPVLLRTFTPPEGETQFAQIEGSFRSFALMNTSGSVYIGTKDIISAWFRHTGSGHGDDNYEEDLSPVIKPALQHQNIASLAFGDWHQLALTADGRVIGFGHEPENCGCLGIGAYQAARAERGIPGNGGELAAPEEGLETFFSRWMRDASSFSAQSEEIVQSFEGVAHGEKTNGSHFAYQIAAGGWLSAALVLVDDDKDELQRQELAGLLKKNIPGIEDNTAFWPFAEERPNTLFMDGDDNNEAPPNPRQGMPNPGHRGGLLGIGNMLRGPMSGRGRIGVPNPVPPVLPNASVGELWHGGRNGSESRPRSSSSGGEGPSSDQSPNEQQSGNMFSRLLGSVSDRLFGPDRSRVDEDGNPLPPPPPQPGAVPQPPTNTSGAGLPDGAVMSDSGAVYVPANNRASSGNITAGVTADGVTPSTAGTHQEPVTVEAPVPTTETRTATSTAGPPPVQGQQQPRQVQLPSSQSAAQPSAEEEGEEEGAPPGTGGFLRDAYTGQNP